VTFDGGVVLGADSRTSTGSYVANRVSDKIVPIHDHVWACRSGSAADTQAVVDYVRHYVEQHRYVNRSIDYFTNFYAPFAFPLTLFHFSPLALAPSLLLLLPSTELGRPPKVKTCATLMRKICYENKDKLMAGLIVGGWDPYLGGQVFEIPLGGTIMEQKFAMGGSGSTYIYGLVDETFREGMSKSECKEFVKNSIAHAMARDGSSGGVIRLVVIDQGGIEKEVILGDRLPYLP